MDQAEVRVSNASDIDENACEDTEKTLRDSSDECLIKLYQCFNHSKLFLVHPTGSGKSRKSAQFFCFALQRGLIDSVLCLVTRENLEKSLRQEFDHILRPLRLERRVTIMKNYNLAKILGTTNNCIQQRWSNAGIFLDEMHNLLPRTVINRPSSHGKSPGVITSKKKPIGCSASKVGGKNICKLERLKLFEKFISNKLCVLASATPLFTDAMKELKAIARFTSGQSIDDEDKLIEYFASRMSFPSRDLYAKYPCSLRFAARANIHHAERLIDITLNDFNQELYFPFYRVLSDEDKINVAMLKIIEIARLGKKQFIHVFYLNNFQALQERLNAMSIRHSTISTKTKPAILHRTIEEFNWSSSSILLTTTIFSEGHGLRNVDYVHLIDPCHQYGSTSTIQALGRSARLGSHSQETVVTVYMYAKTRESTAIACQEPSLFASAYASEDLTRRGNLDIRSLRRSHLRSRSAGFVHRKLDLQKILCAEHKENTIRLTLRLIVTKQDELLKCCLKYENMLNEVENFRQCLTRKNDEWTLLSVLTDIIHDTDTVESNAPTTASSLTQLSATTKKHAGRLVNRNINRTINERHPTNLYDFLDECAVPRLSVNDNAEASPLGNVCTLINNCVLRTSNEIYDLSHIQLSECLIDRKNVHNVLRNIRITLTGLYSDILNKWHANDGEKAATYESYALTNILGLMHNSADGLPLVFHANNLKVPCYYRIKYMNLKKTEFGRPFELLKRLVKDTNARKYKFIHTSSVGYVIGNRSEAITICRDIHGPLKPYGNHCCCNVKQLDDHNDDTDEDEDDECEDLSTTTYMRLLERVADQFHHFVYNDSALHETIEANLRSMIQKCKNYGARDMKKSKPSIVKDQNHDCNRNFRDNVIQILEKLCAGGQGLLMISQSEGSLIEHRVVIRGHTQDSCPNGNIGSSERSSLYSLQWLSAKLKSVLKMTLNVIEILQPRYIDITTVDVLRKLCAEMHGEGYEKNCVCSTSTTDRVEYARLFRLTAIDCKRWVTY
uniref:Helicase domain n=1 Tax=Glypta fumiferanae TaxID=389681 RepID=A0A0F6T1C1_9HYME|nr:helicase domain [Glypta fumiferanae]